jgi:hypothetical protein
MNELSGSGPVPRDLPPTNPELEAEQSAHINVICDRERPKEVVRDQYDLYFDFDD